MCTLLKPEVVTQVAARWPSGPTVRHNSTPNTARLEKRTSEVDRPTEHVAGKGPVLHLHSRVLVVRLRKPDAWGICSAGKRKQMELRARQTKTGRVEA